MATLSNVIAADLTIKVQRMASYPPFGFEFYETETTAIDLTTLVDVRMDIVNGVGVKVKQMSIGAGFEIANNPTTGAPTVLKMDKAYAADNLAAGAYRYDMLVVASETEAGIPVRGSFIVEPNITE
ncbi:hypothetical protein [Chitinophaga japonensis]|uniref:Uncharacterized protein n=1 Tax=Chitinophaga japonensis TaxID=104662 RepID=A0A562SY64_CHIJA|nr:hypothetical protein [Chitinophaga japonensis]TWI86289.1 hypothetical protein LX66_3543 [Chitinophaga japonensis]